MFGTFTLVLSKVCSVPNMAVLRSSLISRFPVVFLSFCLNYFEMVSVAPVIYWYHLCFYIPHALYFYCKVLSFFSFCLGHVSYLLKLQCLLTYKVVQIWPGQTVTCLHTNRPGHIWSTLYMFRLHYYGSVTMSGLLLGIVWSVCTRFHHMLILLSWFVSTDFGTCLYQCSLSNFTPVYFHVLTCSWTHTIMSLCIVLLPILDMLI
jgi:hypothetical protein